MPTPNNPPIQSIIKGRRCLVCVCVRTCRTESSSSASATERRRAGGTRLEKKRWYSAYLGAASSLASSAAFSSGMLLLVVVVVWLEWCVCIDSLHISTPFLRTPHPPNRTTHISKHAPVGRRKQTARRCIMGSWLEVAAASFSTRYTSRSRIVVCFGGFTGTGWVSLWWGWRVDHPLIFPSPQGHNQSTCTHTQHIRTHCVEFSYLRVDGGDDLGGLLVQQQHLHALHRRHHAVHIVSATRRRRPGCTYMVG